LFVVNFGVDKSILDDSQDLEGSQAELKYDFFPADAVSLLTSMATSRTPDEHGVVGKQWFVNEDESVDAYSSAKSSASAPTFPQVIKNHHDEINVITASANPQLAKSINQINSLPFDTLEDGEFKSHHGLSFSKEEALKATKETPFWKSFSTQLENLDVSDSLVESFIMDIEYLRRLTEKMEASESPVLYNVATSTPPNAAAQEILLGAVKETQKAFKKHHPEGTSQIVFMKEPNVISNAESTFSMPLHRKPVEFSVQYPDDPDAAKNTATLTDPRTSQISTWIAFMSLFFVYYFIHSFMTMDYESDATLFTKWKRGQKMGNMGGMDQGFGY